jgi:hypothetical protein
MLHNGAPDMALALMLPVALLLLPFAWCQTTSQLNQFVYPAPRQIGAVAIPFQYGNTYTIEWETTATSYYLGWGSEDRGPYSQTASSFGMCDESVYYTGCVNQLVVTSTSYRRISSELSIFLLRWEQHQRLPWRLLLLPHTLRRQRHCPLRERQLLPR